MPPDATQVLFFISQVMLDPVRIVGAFIGAFFFLLFVVVLIQEMLDNVRSRHYR